MPAKYVVHASAYPRALPTGTHARGDAGTPSAPWRRRASAVTPEAGRLPWLAGTLALQCPRGGRALFCPFCPFCPFCFHARGDAGTPSFCGFLYREHLQAKWAYDYKSVKPHRNHDSSASLPLNSAGRFGSDIIHHPVHSAHFIDDSRRDSGHHRLWQLHPIGGHTVRTLHHS